MRRNRNSSSVPSRYAAACWCVVAVGTIYAPTMIVAATRGVDWILVGVTAALAVFTATLWFATYRLSKKSDGAITVAEDALKLDRERWEVDKAERQHAVLHRQADLVSVMTRYPSEVSDDCGWYIWNDSEAAIFNLRWFSVDQQGNQAFSVDAPNALPPHSTYDRTAIGRPVNHAIDAGLCNGFLFRDNAGVDWIKWGTGRLEQLSDLSLQIAGPEALARMRPGVR